jgi:hypothetical protein
MKIDLEYFRIHNWLSYHHGVEKRILAGKEIIKQCKEQLRNLESLMDDIVMVKRKMFK